MTINEDDQPSRRERPKLWLTNAVGFVTAARLLLENHKTGAMLHWPAFYTNLGFAYEHSLKGYLSFNEWTDEELRRKLGHDINKALSEAIRCGFEPHSSIVGEMLQILGPSHRTNEMRYLSNAPMITPEDPNEACRCAWDHIQAIGEQLNVTDWE